MAPSFYSASWVGRGSSRLCSVNCNVLSNNGLRRSGTGKRVMFRLNVLRWGVQEEFVEDSQLFDGRDCFVTIDKGESTSSGDGRVWLYTKYSGRPLEGAQT